MPPGPLATGPVLGKQLELVGYSIPWLGCCKWVYFGGRCGMSWWQEVLSQREKGRLFSCMNKTIRIIDRTNPTFVTTDSARDTRLYQKSFTAWILIFATLLPYNIAAVKMNKTCIQRHIGWLNLFNVVSEEVLAGTKIPRGKGRLRPYLMLNCRHQNDYALRWAAVSHFNVSLIVRGKVTETASIKQLLKRKESWSGIELGFICLSA